MKQLRAVVMTLCQFLQSAQVISGSLRATLLTTHFIRRMDAGFN
jgi:hypothetical protein